MATHSSILAWRIPLNRGAWRAAVHWVAKSQAQLSDSAQHNTAVDWAVAGVTPLTNIITLSAAKSLQSCLTLHDPMDCSPPGSPFHGILQARILERFAMPSSRGSSQPRD